MGTLKIGGKEVTFERSRKEGSKDLVICEAAKGRKFLLFLGIDTARKVASLVEDLIMGTKQQNKSWNFSETGREVVVESARNGFGTSLLIRTITKNEHKWRRRVFIPKGDFDEG